MAEGAKPIRLPAAQLTLPGGFTIEIKYKTDRQISAVMKTDCYGYWDQRSNGGQIIINRDTPVWRQMKTFGHELVHAVHDYAHWIDKRADAVREEGEKTLKELEEEE